MNGLDITVPLQIDNSLFISATIIETYLARIATSFFESLATVDISGHSLRLRFIIDLLCDMGTKAVQIDTNNKEQQYIISPDFILARAPLLELERSVFFSKFYDHNQALLFKCS